MILKEYQKRALGVVRTYLEHLAEWRDKASTLDPEFGFDWAAKAWQKCFPSRQYVARWNGVGDPLPTFCLKVPTGGGKTLLAIKVIDLFQTLFRRRQTGLVLWIVPTSQIYNQTLRALKDRNHLYRQQLDVLSAGRTLVMEKTTKFAPRDVSERLCILVLMLPSANRRTKEQLRMFRDSSGYGRFFPGEGDAESHKKLLERVPNLDTFEADGSVWGRFVKTSLGNTLRLLRPLIILDEGHKAYSRNAKNTLEDFNPRMIVELSATPPKETNVLVNISGRELAAEEMIKLDLHVKNRAGAAWEDTLLASVEHRKMLEAQALLHEAETGEYIRPICLIQVERTGRDQRRAGVVHAEDVREYLVRHPEVQPEHIAVKTSQTDELKVVDEVGGLLARNCPIRFIITKQALQEGWDCSFAYVLTILTNPASKSALTQLVGRILRQPYARKTGVRWLDESYVFCFQRRGAELLQEVRRGFGREGLQGLEGKVVTDDDVALLPNQPVVVHQRERYRKAVRDLVLPAFMIKDDANWRLVRYETDILSRVPWGDMDVSPLFDLPLSEEGGRDFDLRAGLDEEALTGPPRYAPEDQELVSNGENDQVIDYYFAAGHLLSVVPNPWRGSEAAHEVFDALLEKYPRRQVAANYMFVLEELRKRLELERDRLSRDVFFEMLGSGVMRFLVVTDDLEFNRPPAKVEIGRERQANRPDGTQFALNLHERTSEGEMNALETKVATYLDDQARLFFWYRNRSRKDYYVQGWKPSRVYADFVFALKAEEHDHAVDRPGPADGPNNGNGFGDVYVLETKGLHLKQSEDTEYKRSVFNTCSELAKQKDWAEFAPAMRNKVVRFEVVAEDEWEKRLNALLA